MISRKILRESFIAVSSSQLHRIMKREQIIHHKSGNIIDFGLCWRPRMSFIGDGSAEAFIYGMKGAASNNPYYRIIVDLPNHKTELLSVGDECSYTDRKPWWVCGKRRKCQKTTKWTIKNGI